MPRVTIHILYFSGYVGNRCQIDEDNCLNNQLCQNGAVCVDLPNNFRYIS